jgi:hypothetical protein
MIDLVQAVVLGGIGTALTGALAMTAWGIRRMISKQDKLDLLVRGDGNGTPGIGERIRDVHQDVSTMGRKLDTHITESEGWQGRIVAIETRCDMLHADDLEIE